MTDEMSLVELSFGSAVEGYLTLRSEDGNVPPNWINRYRKARKQKERELAKLLKKRSLDAIPLLREWETDFRKECFYLGIRILLEIEREGTSER